MDPFAFVTFVDITAGTKIYFTDCGADASGFYLPCIEGALWYPVPVSGLTSGDIIRSDINASDFAIYIDSHITGSFATSTGDHQIIVFQDVSNSGGSKNAGNNPSFIFASSTASMLFTGNKADINETGLTPGLSDTGSPRTALGLGARTLLDEEVDNSIYKGTYDFSSGGISSARIALTDPANYYASDFSPRLDPTYGALVAAIPPALILTASCSSTDASLPVPDVSLLPSVNAECQVISLTPPTATDNCGGMVTVTNNATLPITTQGTTVITWAYDDGNGNITFQNQNITFDDTTIIRLFKDILKVAVRPRKDGRSKEGIKAHVMIHAAELMACLVRFTEGSHHDQTFLRYLNLREESYLIMDKGYTYYHQYA